MPTPPAGIPAPTRRAVLRCAGAAAAAAAGLAACDPATSRTATPTRAATTMRTATPTARPTPRSTVTPPTGTGRVLLAYFSRDGENYWYGGRRDLQTGNTAVLAGLIGDRIGCDVHRIRPAEAYPDRYDPTVERNVREQDADARPAMAEAPPEVAGYDTVLLGSPVWNVQPPMIMATFAEAVELSGKTVLPFVTYAVSGLGSTMSFYRDLATGARLGEGFAARGEQVRDGVPELDGWLRSNGLTGPAA